MSADNIVTLDVLSNSEVFWKSNRICSRSESPQRNAGRALVALGVPESATVHFRRWGRVVRAVLLSRLLLEATS
jgi:hypothetical protein